MDNPDEVDHSWVMSSIMPRDEMIHLRIQTALNAKAQSESKREAIKQETEEYRRESKYTTIAVNKASHDRDMALSRLNGVLRMNAQTAHLGVQINTQRSEDDLYNEQDKLERWEDTYRDEISRRVHLYRLMRRENSKYDKILKTIRELNIFREDPYSA